MSDTVTLKAQVRQQPGSRVAARLRQQGLLPAIIYGHKKEPVSVALPSHVFVEALHHGHRIFEVDIEGSKDTLLIKDLQYDHLGKNVIHVDLMRVNLSERVKVQVDIELRGTAKGQHDGGVIEDVLSRILRLNVRSVRFRKRSPSILRIWRLAMLPFMPRQIELPQDAILNNRS